MAYSIQVTCRRRSPAAGEVCRSSVTALRITPATRLHFSTDRRPSHESRRLQVWRVGDLRLQHGVKGVTNGSRGSGVSVIRRCEPIRPVATEAGSTSARTHGRGSRAIRGREFRRQQGVGDGVHEARVHAGPGYRIYYGLDGATLVILLAAGTKASQQRDIEKAKARWKDYKERKQRGE